MYLKTRSTLLWGEHSTAFGYLAPPYSIVIISSLWAAFSSAFTKTLIGFSLVFFSMSVNASSTIPYAVFAFPVMWYEVLKCFLLLCPGTITLLISLSTMNVLLLWNLLPAYLAPVFGTILVCKET